MSSLHASTFSSTRPATALRQAPPARRLPDPAPGKAHSVKFAAIFVTALAFYAALFLAFGSHFPIPG